MSLKPFVKVSANLNPIRFEGDNYSDAWVEEAEKRGLPHYRKTPHALAVLTHDSTIALFEGLGILSQFRTQQSVPRQD